MPVGVRCWKHANRLAFRVTYHVTSICCVVLSAYDVAAYMTITFLTYRVCSLLFGPVRLECDHDKFFLWRYVFLYKVAWESRASERASDRVSEWVSKRPSSGNGVTRCCHVYVSQVPTPRTPTYTDDRRLVLVTTWLQDRLSLVCLRFTYFSHEHTCLHRWAGGVANNTYLNTYI